MTNIIINNFIRDEQVGKLYRATNLTNAVHQVTKNIREIYLDKSIQKDNIYESLEQVKDMCHKLESTSLEIMYKAHSLAKENGLEGVEDIKDETLKELYHLVSLIKIANTSYYMSDMNAELLVKGCVYLTDIIRNFTLKNIRDIEKNSSAELSIQETEKINKALELNVESIKDTNEKFVAPAPHYVKDTKSSVKFDASGKPSSIDISRRSNIKNFIDKRNSNVSEDRKSSRREQVLSLLSREPISIKDISEKIVGCSEKTIQRELNTLLDERKIQRIGEKRWSRYTLAG